MTGSPFQPTSTPSKPPATIRAVGRWHQWATFLFLFAGVAAFGLAWLFGFLPAF